MNYNKADFIASYGISSQLPESDRPELSFSGRSNVGKSSLINKLCNRKNLARVSSTPGKTATINFYEVDNCYFVDLPGYGYAKVSNADRERWDDLINSYFEAPRHHTLLVQLIDCRHAPSADDLQMLKYLHYHQIPFVVALTKADKLKKSQLAKTQEDFEKVCLPYGCQKVVLTSGVKWIGYFNIPANHCLQIFQLRANTDFLRVSIGLYQQHIHCPGLCQFMFSHGLEIHIGEIAGIQNIVLIVPRLRHHAFRIFL